MLTVLQIAVTKFFDGEVPDPVEEARAAQAAVPPPAQAGRREVLLDGLGNTRRPTGSTSREPAPRIVPQPDNRGLYKAPFLLSLVLSPFQLLLRLLSGSLGLFGYLFPFLPRLLNRITNRTPSSATRRNTTGRRPLNPRDTAARFIREFEEEHGSHNLKFFEDGYAQAYDLAKKDLKFLLVVLISPEHDDTVTFVRETLLSPEFSAFVNDPANNLILWAGNVQDSEAYQVSTALNCTKFPFAGLVVHTPQDSSTAMSTVARVTGLLPPATFVNRLRTAVNQNNAAIERVRSTRAEQTATRNLRQEQESAYERSLAQDRERMRLRREAEAARKRAEEEAKAKAEAEELRARQLEQWKRWKATQLPAEPAQDVKDATRLSIRMPDGERIVRKFAAQCPIEDLYAFVECHDMLTEASTSETVDKPDYEHSYSFNLVSPMPRMVYALSSGGTVGEKVGRSGNLIVEPIVEEEEEADDDDDE
jgi:FAS-associated factor 2